MSKTTRPSKRPHPRTAGRHVAARGKRPHDPEAGSIPSTLDPDLDLGSDDIEEELGELDVASHAAPEDEVPEEDVGEITRAAESLPADTPVDRADRTEEREEHPPRSSGK